MAPQMCLNGAQPDLRRLACSGQQIEGCLRVINRPVEILKAQQTDRLLVQLIHRRPAKLAGRQQHRGLGRAYRGRLREPLKEHGQSEGRRMRRNHGRRQQIDRGRLGTRPWSTHNDSLFAIKSARQIKHR